MPLFLLVLVTARLEAEVIVVRPAGWENAIAAWRSHREAEGYRILELEPADSADETRSRIRALSESMRSGGKADGNTIVLMGDAPAFTELAQHPRRTDRVPTFYIDSKVVKHFGSEPIIASDYPYADLDADGRAETSVGRIPAMTPQALEGYLKRVIAYEKAPRTGAWQREVDIVAGVGGFGPLADTIVEGVTRQLLVNDIPNDYRLSMTYASPSSYYSPAPSRFSQSVIDRLNDGGLFWVYLGHGYVDTLDYVPFENRMLPILDRQCVPKIDVVEGPPVCIFLACYVAAFDAKETSMAEQLLLAPDGPIAVIGGSRVTMPYAMGLLGGAMLDECFDHRVERIGELLHRAKHTMLQSADEVRSQLADSASPSTEETPSRREMLDTMAKALSPPGHSLDDERQEHGYLFNLLGDPLLRIHHPDGLLLETAEEVPAGGVLTVRGHAPFAGRLTGEIAYSRQRTPELARQLHAAALPKPSLEQKQAIYSAANDLVCSTCEAIVSSGDFTVELPIPPELHGAFQVQVSVYANHGWAAGHRSLRVVRAANR